jgi:hypothetical protein
MELFHRACLDAIASAAGVVTHATPSGADHDKTDTILKVFDANKSLTVEAQLKSTGNLGATDGQVHYDLDVATYNKLRDPASSNVARMLVVMDLPGEPEGWAACNHDCLRLHRRVFWTHLYGQGPTQNADTQRIWIPHTNLLGADNVVTAMRAANEAFKAANGGI